MSQSTTETEILERRAEGLPIDKEVYIITDVGDVQEVQFDTEASYWVCKNCWSRNDGESGYWSEDEIVGWSHFRDLAEKACAEYNSKLG